MLLPLDRFLFWFAWDKNIQMSVHRLEIILQKMRNENNNVCLISFEVYVFFMVIFYYFYSSILLAEILFKVIDFTAHFGQNTSHWR